MCKFLKRYKLHCEKKAMGNWGDVGDACWYETWHLAILYCAMSKH